MEISDNFFKKEKGIKKSQPEQFLEKGEKILWKGKPRKASYVVSKTKALLPPAIIFAVFDFSILSFIVGTGAFEGEFFPIVLFLFVFFALHLTPLWLYIASCIKGAREISNVLYVITNQRMIEFKDMEIKNFINLEDLKTASHTKSTIDRAFRVGDIVVSGNMKVITLFDIPDSGFIFEKINKLISDQKTWNKKFYSDNIICDHCGTYFSKQEKKCPCCGAPKKIEE